MSSYPALDPVSVVNMLENDDPGSSTSSNSRRANNPYAVGAAAAGGSSSGGQVSPQRSGGFSVTMGDGGGGGATETPLELRGRSTANNNMSGMWLNTSLHEDGRSSRNSSHIAFDFPQGPYGSNTTPPMVAFLASSTSHQLPAPQCSDGRTMGCAFAVECDTNDSSSTSSVQSLHHQGDPIYRQSDPLSPHQDTSPMFEPPGWRPLLHKPLVSSPSSLPEGTSNVRSLDSSHSAHTAQSRHNGSHHPSSQGSLSQNGMRAVALAATSAPSQGPTDTSVEELVALLHAAYRDAHGTEFDLRSAPSSPDGEQSHTMGSSAAPPPQPSVDVRCPAGFVFSVYDTDVREHFSVNSDDVVITAGAIKYVEYFAKYGYQTRFRFQYCKRFVGGRCASGNNCHFLHVSHLPASTSVHVNENAATSHPTAPVSAQMVAGGVNTHRYATMPPGVVFQVYPPNTSSSSPQLITSSQVLHTAGAASVYGILSAQQRKHLDRGRSQGYPAPAGENELSALSVDRVVHFPPDKRGAAVRTVVVKTPSTPPPPPPGLRPRHCAHFQFKRLCNLGSECNFIHALVPYIQGVTLTRSGPEAHQPHPQQLPMGHAPQYAPPAPNHHHHHHVPPPRFVPVHPHHAGFQVQQQPPPPQQWHHHQHHTYHEAPHHQPPPPPHPHHFAGYYQQ